MGSSMHLEVYIPNARRWQRYVIMPILVSKVLKTRDLLSLEATLGIADSCRFGSKTEIVFLLIPVAHTSCTLSTVWGARSHRQHKGEQKVAVHCQVPVQLSQYTAKGKTNKHERQRNRWPNNSDITDFAVFMLTSRQFQFVIMWEKNEICMRVVEGKDAPLPSRCH